MASSSWRSNKHSMSFNKNYKPFPSHIQPTSKTYSPFSTNRGSISNLRNSRQFPSTTTTTTTSTSTSSPPIITTTTNPNSPSSRSSKFCSWFIDWLINRIFSNYPIWIQSIITIIIGFIAYFLYDYASNIQLISYYLIYKTISIILFLISVSFLYLLFLNFNNNKSTKPVPITTNNPYSMPSQNSHKNQPQPMNNSNSNINMKSKSNSRDELYFTNKAMLNRVSSTILKSSEPKYDFNSSPNKIKSLNPTEIITEKNLNNFLSKQKHSKRPIINEYDSIFNINNRPQSSITSNINTPMSKTFGSMRMTPAINNKFESATGRHSFNLWTPNKSLNNTNQGSAGIATPDSSNMNVSMMSYDKIESEPFAADFSVIQPSNQQSVSWNISGFGNINNNNNNVNMSTLAEPGTPGIKPGFNNNNGQYDYDGMYNHINLRGANIGEILKNTTVNNIQQQQRQNSNNKLRITKAPISPCSRKRDIISSSMNDMNKQNKNRMSNIIWKNQ